jgi:hypothetical protein
METETSNKSGIVSNTLLWLVGFIANIIMVLVSYYYFYGLISYWLIQATAPSEGLINHLVGIFIAGLVVFLPLLPFTIVYFILKKSSFSKLSSGYFAALTLCYIVCTAWFLFLAFMIATYPW